MKSCKIHTRKKKKKKKRTGAFALAKAICSDITLATSQDKIKVKIKVRLKNPPDSLGQNYVWYGNENGTVVYGTCRARVGINTTNKICFGFLHGPLS